MEAGIALDARQVQGNDGNLFHIGFFQGTADEAYVIGGTAAASCLGHDDGGSVQIVFSRLQGLHNLTDDQEGRVAGIIVDIL